MSRAKLTEVKIYGQERKIANLEESIWLDNNMGNAKSWVATNSGQIFELLMKNQDLSDEALELIAGRFRMLSEPMRLRILKTLGDNEMSVTELVATTGANQANISKHLSILLHAGIVSRRKEGLTANYRVSDQTIFELCDLVCNGLKDHHETRQSLLDNNFS
ncbi:hypothetical protein BH10ACI2_BH10ACI2_02330 [soil metagenome]